MGQVRKGKSGSTDRERQLQGLALPLVLVLLAANALAQTVAPPLLEGDSPGAQGGADGTEATDGTGSEAGERDDGFPIHGAFSVRYNLRFGDGDSDNDLSERLRFTVGDEYAPGFSGNFYGRMTQDLDDFADQEEFFIWRSLTDSYGDSFNGKIYTGYGNWRPEGTPIEQVRVGRQYLYAGDVFQADAIRLTLRPIEELKGLQIGGFVGIPSHMYEASPDGDLIVGGSASISPWEGGTSLAHYVHLNDRNEYYGGVSNDLWTFLHSQQLGDNMLARASYQHLNGNAYRVTANAEATIPEQDILLTGAFLFSPTRQKELVYDLDPYYAAALDLAPYWTGDFAASIGIGEQLTFAAGAGWRSLFHDSDEGDYNREYTRIFGTLSMDEILVETLSASVTGEFYLENDDTVGALTFEADWRASDTLRLSAGTDFSLYRYDLLTESERYNSTGVFLNLKWFPREQWRVDTRFRIEHDDFDTYGSFRTGIEFGF